MYFLFSPSNTTAYCLIGIAVVVLCVPIHMLVSQATSHLRTQTARQTDRRVKLMHEVLAGMKVIKSYTWEQAFQTVGASCSVAPVF